MQKHCVLTHLQEDAIYDLAIAMVDLENGGADILDKQFEDTAAMLGCSVAQLATMASTYIAGALVHTPRTDDGFDLIYARDILNQMERGWCHHGSR